MEGADQRRDALTYLDGLFDTWVDETVRERRGKWRGKSGEKLWWLRLMRPNGSTRGVRSVRRASGDSNGLHVKCERKNNQG